MKKDTSQDRYLYIIGWIGIGILLAYLVLKYVCHIDLIDYAGPCVLHTLTGFYCPGCGGTRAVFAFFQGELWQSFLLHPFVPYLGILGGWFMISQTIERLSCGRVKIAMHFRMVYVWIALILIFGNFIWKNLVLILEQTALI